MREGLVRLSAFFGKEYNVLRRQPRLILALLLGPLLILLLVGLGYRGQRPPLSVALVVPPNAEDADEIQRFVETLERSFQMEYIGDNPSEARDLLAENEVELVQIIPSYAQEALQDGRPLTIDFVYNEVNPQNVQYMQWASGQQANVLNEYLLSESIETMRASLSGTTADIERAQQVLDELEGGTADLEEAQGDIRSLRVLLQLLAVADMEEQNAEQLDGLITELTELENMLESGQETLASDQVDDIRQRMNEVTALLQELDETPTSAIISPIRIEHQNLSTSTLSLVTFFAPAVTVFILQHIAVTLGALSLVQERMRGTREFYAAAPMSTMQVLIGKYVAYLLFTSIIAVGLTVLLVTVLDVPFVGNVLPYIGYMALFLLASLGIGFLISTISPTDIQAVQLSMLVLLLAVFFSGFVIPVNYYTQPIRFAGVVLPVTHAIEGMQAMLFRGAVPAPEGWAAMGAIALITLTAVVVIWRQQFRQAK